MKQADMRVAASLDRMEMDELTIAVREVIKATQCLKRITSLRCGPVADYEEIKMMIRAMDEGRDRAERVRKSFLSRLKPELFPNA